MIARLKLFIQKVRSKIKRKLFDNRKFDNDKDYLINRGIIRINYKMDLDNPKSFNEKLNWYKMHYRNDLMITCTDKYAVRDYVKEKGLERILLKNYGVYDKVEDIDLDSLPNQFVAKVTGDSGGVVVCKDKSKFYSQIGNKFSYLDKDYSATNKEWHYHYINNRIIVEELIKTENSQSPNDYKFFCFNGEPKFLFVASDRDTDCKFDFYDMEWNHINVVQGHPHNKNGIKKPEKFEEMIEICKILSKDFPHVRVDLYYENGNIYFGELTFFHYSGMTPFMPRKFDYEFGKYFDITGIKNN